jgi:hypothetical protein
MKKLLLFMMLFVTLQSIAQVSPIMPCRVANWTTQFGQNLPIGTEIFIISDSTKWITKTLLSSTAYMSGNSSNCIPLSFKPLGTLPITITGSAGRYTIGVNLVTTLASGIMSAADKIKLNGIANGATANVGTVTSVDMSVPTGLSISGNPITTNGSLALSFITGYSIPTIANQNIWTGKQNALNGTGLVRMSGTSISYDNTSYWHSGNHPTTTAAYGLPSYPTTLPASDVYAWAKSSVKPSYTYSEVGSISSGDSRLSDARTPLSHAHGNITNGGYIGSTATLPIITGTGGIVQAGSWGSTAGTFAQGNHTHTGQSNNSVQFLSGTTISWVITNGVNAYLTLSGNTTITLSSLVAGQTGNIRVTNASSSYTLTVAGYTNKIATVVYSTTNQLKTSGGSYKIDVFSWWYDGTYLFWNGTLNYN